MSLTGFLADGQAVVQNGLKLWSEKSFGRRPTHHELMAVVGTEARPTIFFMLYGWAKGPWITGMIKSLRK